MIGDMSIKPIVKFVVFLTSLLKKSTNYLKKCYILKNYWAFYRGKMGLFFGREILFWLWGLRPRPWADPAQAT